MNLKLTVFLTGVIPLLSACSTLSGRPTPLAAPDRLCDAKALTVTNLQTKIASFGCVDTDWFISTDESGLKTKRNNFITLQMYVIDKRYDEWEQSLLNEVREGNFGTTLALLGISGVASVIKQGKTSKALAASSTVITGAKQGFDRDILFERTIPVLMTQMRASRAKAKELILKRLASPYSQWTIGLALSDLQAYENAGSISAALMAMAESSAAAKTSNEADANAAIRTIAYDGSLESIALQDYMDVDEPLYSQRKARLVQVMQAMKIAKTSDRDIAEFLSGENSKKRAIITELITLEGADTSALKILVSGLSNK